MNKISLFLVTTVSFILFNLVSCDDREEGPSKDNIGLSQKEFILSNEEHEIQVITQKKDWKLTSYTLNGITTTINDDVFTEAWITVEKESPTSIKIILNENKTNEKRTIQIMLMKENYADYINIVQNP